MNDGGALLGPVGFLVAFFLGTIGFFSPCVIPVLPGYLAFLGGVSGEVENDELRSRRRVVLATLLFVAGFAIVFAAMGALLGALGRRVPVRLLEQISGVIVIVLGVALALPRLVPILEREYRPFFARAKPGLRGALPLGMAFAIGWVPCAGPGLGTMLGLATQEGRAWHAALLLVFFALGLGIWFVLAAFGASRLLRSDWLRRRLRIIQIIGGVLMIWIGALLFTGQWTRVMAPVIRWGNSLFGY